MASCRAFLRIVRETFDELRQDFEEIIELVFEQIGLNEIWTRGGDATNALIQYLRPNRRGTVCGRHRSLIRMIGSKLRLKPAKRMQIRVEKSDYETFQDRSNILDVFYKVLEAIRNDAERLEKFSEVPIGLQGLLINENHHNDEIKHRWSFNREERPFYEIEDSDDDCSDNKKRGGNTSTPKKRNSVFREDLNDVVSLHAELEKLRLQIASIVTVKEFTVKKRSMVPPPPPPPLPPISLFATGSNQRIPLVNNTLEQVQNGKRSQDTIDRMNRANLIEILKDIGNVKLRKTDRSPGGTPLRRKARFEPDANDPAAIMASALKKRFAHHLQALQESLEKENIDTDPDDSVWDTSSSFTSPVVGIAL